MIFSKLDLDAIKSKITLSRELENKTKIIKKGKDSWCCCPFHKEKTPSCKINDELGNYYCFGCGAKGDIFSLYTDLYNYSFVDAVKELSQKAGIVLKIESKKTNDEYNRIYKILDLTTNWFQENLNDVKNNHCLKYLEDRNLNKDIIKYFRLGFSYNSKTTLYDFLKDNSFNDKEIIKSNVVKYDRNNKIKDFFYKRLMFPITNLQGKVVGFGGRTLENSNPKYINSPESNFFQKRNLLYNLVSAKNSARSKKNLLICEGYMDVIKLHQSGIQSVVSPLGTAFTEDQLKLSWRYVNKPTVMFDGDSAGVRAAFKAALMSLPLLVPGKFIQFISLPNNVDPDSFLNDNPFKDFINILKKPTSLIEFIFEQSSQSLDFNNADDKIVFDKYLDDISSSIKNKKIQYFYKNELKNLFFKKLKNRNLKKTKLFDKINPSSLQEIQIQSFFATLLNHKSIRQNTFKILKEANFLDIKYQSLIEFLESSDLENLNFEQIIDNCDDSELVNILNKCRENKIYQLFPYSSPKYDSILAMQEISDSVKNLNTRLLNLKKINKSLDTFVSKTNSMNWDDLQRIKKEIQIEQEKN